MLSGCNWNKAAVETTLTNAWKVEICKTSTIKPVYFRAIEHFRENLEQYNIITNETSRLKEVNSYVFEYFVYVVWDYESCLCRHIVKIKNWNIEVMNYIRSHQKGFLKYFIKWCFLQRNNSGLEDNSSYYIAQSVWLEGSFVGSINFSTMYMFIKEIICIYRNSLC